MEQLVSLNEVMWWWLYWFECLFQNGEDIDQYSVDSEKIVFVIQFGSVSVWVSGGIIVVISIVFLVLIVINEKNRMKNVLC